MGVCSCASAVGAVGGIAVFWIYENWVADKKAVVHRADCGYCNEGAGAHQNTQGDRNGRWHGPFNDYAAARAVADALPDRTVRDCSRCI